MEKVAEKIAIGSDHGGFELKERLKVVLAEAGCVITDVGCPSPAAVDYPDIAQALLRILASGACQHGILICGTGIGMSIAANRDRRFRAALCHDEYTARMSREHNDANILCLGARVIGAGVAEGIVRTWLTTTFAGGRHQMRIDKMRG
ncbi:MAG TPA: ribose 5-phosphate isomerase B [Desulfobulbaceae bacterium]|nr:ribose 5-phosphate isomerase B [Desulfobulbaceae bacterium]